MERAYVLFGENIRYLEGAKTKRMHVYVDAVSNEKFAHHVKDTALQSANMCCIRHFRLT